MLHCVMGRWISSAVPTLTAFPEWNGAKLLCAQAQGMYWFLVMRSDLGAKPGGLEIIKGRNIGAAPLVAMGLRWLLHEAGIDMERDAVNIVAIPGSHGRSVNFGVMAAQALEDRKIDGFWANGMGAALAVRRGVGTVVIDVRRGDGPQACFNFTMPVIVTSDRLIEREPEAAASAIKAVVATQTALKRDVSLATQVGRKLFPKEEANLIAELIRRDLPFYDFTISEVFVTEMTAFARSAGLLRGYSRYEQVVVQQFRHLWAA
jgi:NitT/TauT family transport system substrate-binding protein